MGRRRAREAEAGFATRREDHRRPADRAFRRLGARQPRDERGWRPRASGSRPARAGRPRPRPGPGGARPRRRARRASRPARPGRRAARAERSTVVGSPGALEDAHLLRQLLGEAGGPGLRLGSASPRSSPPPPGTAGATSRARPARGPRARPGAGRRAPARSPRRGAGRSRDCAHEGLGGSRASGRRAPRPAPSGRGAPPAPARATPPGAISVTTARRRPRSTCSEALAREARRGRGDRGVHEAGDRHRERLRDPEQQPELTLVVDARHREHDLAGAAPGRSPQALEVRVDEVGGARGRPGTAARAAPGRGAPRSRSPRSRG